MQASWNAPPSSNTGTVCWGNIIDVLIAYYAWYYVVKEDALREVLHVVETNVIPMDALNTKGKLRYLKYTKIIHSKWQFWLHVS